MSENGTHVLPLKIYLLIFTVLLVMTGVTVQVAYLDLGFMNTVAALGIACFKASLVVLYFMHLRYSSSLPKLFWVAGLLWLAILLTFAMSDYLSRQWIQQPRGWAENRAASLSDRYRSVSLRRGIEVTSTVVDLDQLEYCCSLSMHNECEVPG